jgi:hypothetical protein
MNTGQHFFDQLSDKEKIQFKSNFDKYRLNRMLFFDRHLKIKHESFYVFVIRSFTWRKTPQNHKYWSKIASRKVD